MNYWFDAFSGRTWDEFRKAGASVSGFNERFRKQVKATFLDDIAVYFDEEN